MSQALCQIVLFLLLDAVFSCTQNSVQYKRTGESLTLQFQAITVNPEDSILFISNTITSPNGGLLTLTYLNGALIGSNVKCNNCTFIGDAAAGDLKLRIDDLQAVAAVTYKHIANGNERECTTVYILGVPTKPVLTIDIQPSVGESVRLTCSSTSTTTPNNHGLSLIYSWKVNDTTLSDPRYSYSTNKHVLTITNVQKEDGSNIFTCTATENVSNGYTSLSSNTMSPNVLYGPESLRFSPSDTAYEQTENIQLGPVTCSAICNPSCSFKWIKLTQGTTVSNTAVLNLGKLTSSEAGTYRCTATRSVSANDTKDLTVDVIYGPRSMSFSPAATSYREEEGFQFQSVRCNSQCWECAYNWTGPNSYRSTTAVLNIGILTKAMAGDYICMARNLKSTQQPEQSKQLKVEVRYGPDSVSVMPVNLDYTVDEGSTLDNIICSADCFPACSYRWTKEGQSDTVSSTNTLPLGRVEKSFTGRYTCTANNGDTQSKQSHVIVTITVRYGPYNASTILTPPTQQYTENEGTSFSNITCLADCYPACTYTWTNVRQGVPSLFRNGSVLSLGQLTRDEAAKYICSAINPYKSASPTTFKEVTLNVRYGPDTPRVNVQLPVTATEGESVQNVVCSSDCYPGCSFSWKNNTDNAISSLNHVFSLGVANRYKTGSYTCTARNSAQQYQQTSVKTVPVIVNYAPDVNVRLSSTDVHEGASLTLYCDGSGFPTVYNYLKATQKWNDVLISNENNELSGTQTNSSIHFKQLQLQDTGTYTCALNNGIRDTDGVLNQVSSRNLTVEVPPKILKDEFRFTGATGEIVEIEIPVYSFPDIKTWNLATYYGDTITAGEKYNLTSPTGTVRTTFYGTSVSLRGHVISVTINDLQEDDFGNYTLTITNSLGSTHATLFVIAQGKPSAPIMFQQLPEYDNPTFVWKKNFNGGLEQIFIIQTSVADTGQWTNRTNVLETDKQHKLNDTFYVANITGLPAGVYSARIYAYNTEGESEFVTLDHTFEVRNEEEPGSSMAIEAIAGGTTSAVVVIILVVVVVLVVRRRSGKGDGSQTKLNTRGHIDEGEDDEDEVNTVNPMYVPADEVQRTDNVYAQPIKKKKGADVNQIYAMVDKKPKIRKNEADIYENATDTSQKNKTSLKEKLHQHDENVYENPETDLTKQQKKKPVNKDGLIYADLTFNDQAKGKKKLVIHGLDDMTEYVEVDFSKKAEPLPDSDEEDTKNKQ